MQLAHRIERVVVSHDGAEMGGVETDAEHGRTPQETALMGRETVDPGGDQCLDRRRQRVEVATGTDRVHQLEDEQRVTAGSLGQRGDDVLWQRCVAGRHLDEPNGEP